MRVTKEMGWEGAEAKPARMRRVSLRLPAESYMCARDEGNGVGRSGIQAPHACGVSPCGCLWRATCACDRVNQRAETTHAAIGRLRRAAAAHFRCAVFQPGCRTQSVGRWCRSLLLSANLRPGCRCRRQPSTLRVSKRESRQAQGRPDSRYGQAGREGAVEQHMGSKGWPACG